MLAACAPMAVRPRNAPLASPQCTDDYVTIEHVSGIVEEIKPAPEPFPTADIFMTEIGRAHV